MLYYARHVLYPPSRQSFESAQPRASLAHAILFTVVVGVLAGICGGILNIFFADGSVGDVVVLMMFNGIRFVVALLLTQGFIFSLASILGAQGQFESEAYLAALFSVPLNFIGTLALGMNAAVPGTGFAVGVASLTYQIVLTVPMLRAVFGNEWKMSGATLLAIAIAGNIFGATVSTFLPQ